MRDDIEFNIQFCEVVQQFPCLYDHSRSDYCNRHAQDQAWQKIAERLNTKAADCKERWKNLRGRYNKYKNQTKQSSGSGAKKIKQYYLADHLYFLDSFLKSRQSKGNIVTEVDVTQEGQEEEEGNTCDGNLNEDTVEERTQNFNQGENNPTTGGTSKLPTSLHPPTPEPKNDNGYRKRSRSSATLYDVNSSAVKYFETKQRLLDKKSPQSTSTQPDPDMAFLYSILPDMKAMDSMQKRHFKIEVMQLIHKTFTNTEVSPRNSSVYSTSTNTSSLTTFHYSPPSTDVYVTQDEAAPALGQQLQEEEGSFNITNYLNYIPK